MNIACPLSGKLIDARFHPGDLPSKDSLNYHVWKPVRVPGSWQSQGLGTVGDSGWYALVFKVPKQTPPGGWGVTVGIVSNSGEMFIEGESILKFGSTSNRTLTNLRDIQVARIPERAFEDGLVEIFLRVASSYGASGITGGPVKLGDYQALVTEKYQTLQSRFLLQSLLTAAGAAWVISLLGISRGNFADISHNLAIVFASFVFLISLLEHEIVLPLRVDGIIPTTVYTFSYLGALATLPLYLRSLRFSPEKHYLLGAVILSILTGLLIEFGFRALNQPSLPVAAWSLFGLGCLAMCSWESFQSIRQNNRLGIRMGFAGLLLLIALVWETLLYAPLEGSFGKAIFLISQNALMSPLEIAYIGFLMFLGWTAIQHWHLREDAFHQLSQRVMSAHEEERGRIARELHDGIAQSLQALRLDLQIQGNKAPAKQVGNVIEEVREISQALQPAFLRDNSLQSLLEELVQQYETAETQFEVNLNLSDELPDSVKEATYRIAQEALRNAITHSGASRIRLSVQFHKNNLTIDIADNGRGFRLKKNVQSEGQGLANIRERADLLGATCQLSSTPGKGTRIRVNFLLNQSP